MLPVCILHNRPPFKLLLSDFFLLIKFRTLSLRTRCHMEAWGIALFPTPKYSLGCQRVCEPPVLSLLYTGVDMHWLLRKFNAS